MFGPGEYVSDPTEGRRCLTGVDSRSKELSKFVSIDEESNHEIVHALCLGEADRAAYEPLDPGPQIDMFALDFLCVLLAHLMLLGIEMPLVGPPAVGGKLRDAKRGQQLLELQEDVVLSPAEHIRQDLPPATRPGARCAHRPLGEPGGAERSRYHDRGD